jgi:hypothetical protein
MFIHVTDGSCDELICTDAIPLGRLNYWLLALRAALGLFVLSIMKDEFAQFKKKGSLSEYYSETQNFYDTGV